MVFLLGFFLNKEHSYIPWDIILQPGGTPMSNLSKMGAQQCQDQSQGSLAAGSAPQPQSLAIK